MSDIKAPSSDCFDETVNLYIKNQLSQECHGNFACSYELPTILLDPVCDGMKREANIEHICGKMVAEVELSGKFTKLFS